MNKNRIRLTESDLHRVIKESVKKVLNELDWKTYANAARKDIDNSEIIQYDDNGVMTHRTPPHDTSRSMEFKKAAKDAFQREHGLEKGDYLDSLEDEGDFYINGLNSPTNGIFAQQFRMHKDYPAIPPFIDSTGERVPQRAKDDLGNYLKGNYDYEQNGQGWHLKDNMDESIRRAIRKVLR